MYKCPKCGGTKLYYANKQVDEGIGLYRYSGSQKRPFCHTHDIEAVWYGKQQVDWAGGATSLFFVAVIGFFVWAFLGFPGW